MNFFVNKIENPQISEEVNKRLKHGSENEINAVATLVSKVLPVYQPKSVFREEGCETVVHNDRVLIVVSPDGSVRKTDDNGDDAITAVEIKCPYPGKIFTTPVYYEIPWYYVCQVILEMHVLRTETLFFICYTEESTTVFEIYFDRDLWQDINECIVNTYGSCDLQIMKKLPPQTANLKEKVKRFCKENVTFIAEIPSVKVSKVCAHQAVSGNFNEIGYNLHGETSDGKNVGNIKCTVSDMITNIHDTRDAVAEAYSLCRQLANEVLVFLISDLDRIHKREQQYSVPVAYAFKGYSLQCSVMRQMIIDVIRKCFDIGLYIPALSFDGQWAKIAVRSKCDAPLTVLQLQKDVFKEAKATTRADIMGILKSSNVVKAETFTEFNEQVQYQLESNELNKSHVYVLYRAKACEHMFKTSIAVKKLMSAKDVSKERGNTNTAEMLEEESSGHNDIRSTLPPEIAESLDDGIISAMDSLRVDSNQRSKPENQELFNIGELFESGRAYEPEPMEMDSIGHSVGHNINNSQDREDMDTSTGNLSDNIFGSVLQDTRKDSQGYSPNILLSESDKCDMLHSLSVNPKIKSDKWNAINEFHFNEMILTKEKIMVSFTKHELATCLRTVSARLKELNVSFSISWKKEKLVDFFYKLLTLPIERLDQVRKSRVKSYKVQSLKTICANTLNKCSKHVLSCIYAEYLFPIRLLEWQKLSPFSTPTRIQGLPEAINWYSMPEYEDESYTYMFHMLDCHHLFVNARVKCCSTGITERGIKRQAWIKVAEKSSENGSGLSLAIVEDLVDKQSNAFAQKTFSIKVEQVMRENGDIKEAEFCKVIREWYAAEDDPGIDVMERIKRRLRIREWLLEGVDFHTFPPYGTHVVGVPHIMFEGILTNVERRIQIIPYIKSGTYNPRSLGSLEAENFFGEFQDLDPRGSGVIRPDDIPKALSTACQLIEARLNPCR